MVSSTPYWWEDAPPASPPQVAVQARGDVVIIGAGYIGAQCRAHASARRPSRPDLRPAAPRRGGFDAQRRHRQRQPAAQPSADDPPVRRGPRQRHSRAEAKAARGFWPSSSGARRSTASSSSRGASPARPSLANTNTSLAKRTSSARPSSGSRPMPSPAPSSAACWERSSTTAAWCATTSAPCIRLNSDRGMLALAERAGAIVHSETAVRGFTARIGGLTSRRPAAGSRPTTSSSAPTATRTASTRGCAAGSCPCAAASSPPLRSPTT